MISRITIVGALAGAAVLQAVPEHPCLLISQRDIPRLRTLAEQTEADSFGNVPSQAWEKLKAKADYFVNAPPYSYTVTIPGKEGAEGKEWTYALSAERPPPHDDFKHYPPWTAMFQERSDSITTRLKYLLLAYVVTGEERYVKRAKTIVLALCNWDGIWTDRSYSSGVPCLDTGHAAVWVAIFHDWCQQALSKDETIVVRNALASKAVQPIADLIGGISPYHNYTAVVATGLGMGAISLMGHDERAEGWLDLAIERLRLYMDAQGSDGGAMEGPGYGTYAANQLADMLWALGGIGRAEELSSHPFLISLPQYCITLLDPRTKKMPCFGDGGPTVGFISLMRVLALQGNAAAAWYCSEGDGLPLDSPRAFLSVDAARIKPREPEFRPSGCFRDIGYAVLRDGFNPDSLFMAVKSGPSDDHIGHNHFDHGSFLLRYGSEWIGWDPGYRNYFDPPRRRYTSGTFGHNTVVLDLDDDYIASTSVATPGKDQVSLIGARILDMFKGDLVDYVQTDNTAPYNSEKLHVMDAFQRDFLYLKPGIVVILDQLRTPASHTFSVMLHAPQGASYELDGAKATAIASGAFLDSWFFSESRIGLRTGLSPGDGAYGAWLAATTDRVDSARVVTILAPRLNDQILMNPGFERGMSGWRPRNMPGFIENHVIDRSVSHSGNASARIDNGGYYYSRSIPVVPGTKISASWWAKCTASTGAASLFYYWRHGKSFANAHGPKADTDEWRRYSFEDVVPEGTEEVCLALQFFGQGQCWYDDVELTTDQEQLLKSVPSQVTELVDNRLFRIERDGVEHLVLVGGGAETYAGHTYAASGSLAWFGQKKVPVGFSSGAKPVTYDGKVLPVPSGEWNFPGEKEE